MLREFDEIEGRILLSSATQERRNLEFKPPFIWAKDVDQKDLHQKERTIRAIIGMSNTPTGGHVIVGVEEDENHTPIFTGLNNEQMESFQNIESIEDEVESYSSEPINFEPARLRHDGKDLVIFSIEEFEEMPSMCRRNGPSQVILEHVIYARAKKGKPSTIRITERELREIVEMAARKLIVKAERLAPRQENVVTNYFKQQIADLEGQKDE